MNNFAYAEQADFQIRQIHIDIIVRNRVAAADDGLVGSLIQIHVDELKEYY